MFRLQTIFILAFLLCVVSCIRINTQANKPNTHDASIDSYEEEYNIETFNEEDMNSDPIYYDEESEGDSDDERTENENEFEDYEDINVPFLDDSALIVC